MAFVYTESRIMPKQAIASIISTTAAVPVGTIVRGKDSLLGEAEFIYLPSTASVTQYNLCIYRQGASAALAVATRTTVSDNVGQQVCVAQASGSASTFGWFMIAGTSPVLKTAVIISANKPVFTGATAGRIKALASAGQQVLGIKTGAAAVSATSTVVCTFNRPHLQGQIT